MSLVVIDEIVTAVGLGEFATELSKSEDLAVFVSLEAVEELWNHVEDTYEVRCIGTRADSTKGEVFIAFGYHTDPDGYHTVSVTGVFVDEEIPRW